MAQTCPSEDSGSECPRPKKSVWQPFQDISWSFTRKARNDGSGKCDAYPTLVSNNVVIGVLFELDQSEKLLLDGAEGIGVGYEERIIGITLDTGSRYEAFAYFAICIDPSLKPYHWYKEHVLRGAVENRLPETYINSIQCVESIDDPNSKRALHELSIYR